MTVTRPTLDHYVELFELALPDDQHSVLVRLADLGHDVEIGVLSLDGIHPAKLLDGFEAPAEWFALGLVTRGWAAPVDAGRLSRHPARWRVTTTVLVDRAGTVAGRSVGDDGTVIVPGPPSGGRLLDLLRAALA